MNTQYLHGFDEVEQARLVSQASVLENKIFEKINFNNPTSILEIGCGVGAQTEILLKRYPNAKVTGIELSEVQLNTAKVYLSSKFSDDKYALHQMNAEQMTFADNSFDAIYICWVLEHVKNPLSVLKEAKRVLKPNGIIYCTEVQNNHLHLEPYSIFLMDYWQKYNRLQIEMGGDPFVGVKMGHFLSDAGFAEIDIYPQHMLHDKRDIKGRERLVNYWTELMLSGFNNLLEHLKVEPSDREKIISEMNTIKTHAEGVFSYVFMQARAIKNLTITNQSIS
ncbi:MAG: class I SAM-dependent methyltransferase [Bacteroidia bacterium]